MNMIIQNYTGQLLASHPKRRDPYLRRSAVLIIDHDAGGAIGLQINKRYANNVSVNTVMNNLGLQISDDQPLFHGGAESPNRIHVVHSLDWHTASTIKLSDNIGISNDMSVLTAISEDEGPEYFRVVAGFTRWLPNQLDGEITGATPWNITHSWSSSPVTFETVFELDDVDQWWCIHDHASKQQIANWF